MLTWAWLGVALAEEPAKESAKEPEKAPETTSAGTPPAEAVPGAAVPAALVPLEAGRDEDAMFGGGADEDAMFGHPASPAPAAGADTTDLGEVTLERTTDADISDRLAEHDDVLTLGGQLYLRLNVFATEDADLGEASWSSPNLLDVFLDARPNDRVRAYAQGRLQHDFTVQDGETDFWGEAVEPTHVTLDQLWIKGDIGRKVFVTAGQQRIKWGTGRFWNPSDFLNPTTYNPLSTFDERTGVALLKLHVPLNAVNLYAVGSFEQVPDLAHTGGAARAEVVVGSTELALSGMLQKDAPVQLGADLSSGFWLIDFHVEGAVRHGVTTPHYEGTLDFDTFTFPKAVSQEDDWIPEVVAGAEIGIRYGAEDTLYLGGEYFYNGMGYDDPDLYPALQINFDALASGADITPETLANDAFRPFYLGRHYASAYALLAAPGEWDDTSFTLSVITNLSDRTGAVRLDARHTALTWLALNAYVQGYYGDYGEFKYSLTIPAVPFVDGLEDGVTVSAPLGSVGIGAQVSF